MPLPGHLARLASLLLVLLVAAPAAFADDDDEPVSVPFTDMTDEEWDRIQERRANYHLAWALWSTYDVLSCVSQVTHEQRLEEWRKAVQAYNNDPSKPNPGDRPSQQPPSNRPTLPRPASMPPFQGCA